MTHVNIDIDIARSAEDVFTYIANFENNPLWQDGMKEARITSEGPLRVGTTYEQVATFLGRRIISTFEVLEYEPGRMVKAKSISGSFPIQFMRSVTPIDGGTKVTAVITGDANGFFRLFSPLLNRMVQRQIEGDYANLKRIMEAEIN